MSTYRAIKAHPAGACFAATGFAALLNEYMMMTKEKGNKYQPHVC